MTPTTSTALRQAGCVAQLLHGAARARITERIYRSANPQSLGASR